MADLPYLLGGVLHNYLFKFFISLRTVLNELFIHKTFVYDHVHHTVCKGDIGSRLKLDMYIGLLGQSYITRIDHNKSCSPVNGLPYLHSDNRMCFLGIRTNQHDAVHITCYITYRVGHCSGSESHCQSRNCSRVTYSCAVIDIIRTECTAHHLLQHITVLIGRTRACESRKCIRTVFLLYLREPCGYQIKRLIPGSPFELSGLFVLNKRIFKPLR